MMFGGNELRKKSSYVMKRRGCDHLCRDTEREGQELCSTNTWILHRPKWQPGVMKAVERCPDCHVLLEEWGGYKECRS
jgi:hypothetical protein